MSQQLINRNPDLKKLQHDGYEVVIKEGHLMILNVPYVNSQKQVKKGILVSVLDLNENKTTKPSIHIVHFTGEHPCNKDGSEMQQLKHETRDQKLATDLTINHSFSQMPLTKDQGRYHQIKYRDYYHKMQTYIEIISEPARKIQPGATAKTYVVPQGEDEPDSVFNYIDSMSTRAGIAAISDKLKISKVSIIGLGGSGSYVLDLIAKTPIQEIHLFDNDLFLQHNAFRSPGAPSIKTFESSPKKVDYFSEIYSHMHKGIKPYSLLIDENNLTRLDDMDFVFICIDAGDVKRSIVEKLKTDKIPFIDVGLGIQARGDKLGGLVRVTTCTPDKQNHLDKKISFSNDPNNCYEQNIQIADMNALGATLAVIKWKKLFGFYDDLENEHNSDYTIDGNIIDNSQIDS